MAYSGPTQLLIDGKWVNSTSGKKFATVNPKTEEVICEVQEADKADVDIAVAAARKAFKSYSTTDGSARRDMLLKLANLIERDAAKLAEVEAMDNGKAVAIAQNVDIGLAIKCFRYYAGWADKLTGKTIPIDGNFFCYTRHEAIGVCGQIIPWNFPILMMTWKLAPALACGCTIVMKSSEKTPLTCLMMGELVMEAGFPPGVVNLLSGYGPTAGEAIARHMDIDKVAFTGSSAVGHMVMKAAAESNLKRVSLELGGKSPMIVCADADLDQAAEAARVGLYLNSGQCCIASSRIYVEESIYDQFAAKCVEKSKTGMGPGAGAWDEQPIVDKVQFDKVLGYIEAGKKDGAKLLVGGAKNADKGYFVQPTVFSEVTDNMRIAKEEIFGPVMSLLKFTDLDDVIERCNNTIYGLGAGICSRDIGRCMKFVNAVRAGTVYVNCYDKFDCAAPFGGFKESGHGRELGEYGLENYTEVKTVIIPIDK
jgi:aldehyde dehydrogenase (NAD+)